MTDILDGGTPFIDLSLHRRLNPEGGEFFTKDIELPDFMNRKKVEEASST